MYYAIMHIRTDMDTPLGEVTLVSDGQNLTGLYFSYTPSLPASIFSLSWIPVPDLPVFEETCKWLTEYFQGKEPEFMPDISLVGTPFQLEVWSTLRTIPYGSTVTYGAIAQEIAAKHGRKRMSAQAVGNAIHRNPVSILVPCHRVIGKDGSLTGYAGGLWRKQQLLSMEKALRV